MYSVTILIWHGPGQLVTSQSGGTARPYPGAKRERNSLAIRGGGKGLGVLKLICCNYFDITNIYFKKLVKIKENILAQVTLDAKLVSFHLFKI